MYSHQSNQLRGRSHASNEFSYRAALALGIRWCSGQGFRHCNTRLRNASFDFRDDVATSIGIAQRSVTRVQVSVISGEGVYAPIKKKLATQAPLTKSQLTLLPISKWNVFAFFISPAKWQLCGTNVLERRLFLHARA